MHKIHILPDHEARKIAAGEVVERPASVVKELLENALDAGATEIKLAVHEGGKQRISITDNGCGMSCEDAALSLQHHATSKIRSVNELPHIATFGFRGEALSSIASVSILRLITKQEHDECGSELVVEHGEVRNTAAIATPVGTQLIIDHLFENVPARRKFLKHRDTEWRAIHQIATAYALGFPSVGFTVYHDDTLVFTAPSCSTLLERAQQLFPLEISRHFVPYEHTERGVTVTGVTSDYQVARYDRRSIYSFVNHRWVKNTVLCKALLAGYSNILPTNKFPVAATLITVPPEQVDINIHPRKEEVLLMHPHLVSDCIEHAVQKALQHRTRTLLHTGHALNNDSSLTQRPAATTFFPVIEQREVDIFEPLVARKIRPEIAPPLAFTQEALSEEYKEPPERVNVPQKIPTTYTLIGQLHATYILVEVGQGLVIFDQHAAHEAVLYDQLHRQASLITATKLLFPECISYDSADTEYIPQLIELLRDSGIIAELWDPTRLMVTAATTSLQGIPIPDIVHTALSSLRGEFHEKSANHDDIKKYVRDKLFATAACKKAVKAGDTLSTQEMTQLIDTCSTHPHILSCPHGRPIQWLIEKGNLERWFKR